MGPVMVVVVDPGTEFKSGLFDGLEAVAPTELFFEGFDETLAQAVLLRSVWGDVFLFESVVADHGTVLARSEDQAIVMTKQHVGRCAAQCAKAREQRLFQGAFGSFGSTRPFERMAEYLAGAAVNDGHKDTPTIAPAVDEGQIGGPTLVGTFGDGAGYFDAWALARTTLGKSPAFEFHEAVDLLAVDVQSIAEAQTAPSAPDAARRFLLVDLLDAGSERLVNGLGPYPAWLVVSSGTGKADPSNDRGNGERFARREELFLNMTHEFASGRVFPKYSRAI